MNQRNTFLSSLASFITDNFSGRLDELIIILPNNRAKLFLTSSLQKTLSGIQWLPEMKSSKELMEDLSGLSIADEIFLLTHLFKAWKAHANVEDGFHQFMQQGSTLLKDFTEMDQQLVNTDQLFASLREIRTMESWQPGVNRSEMHERYLKFCENLPGIYQTFTELLLENNLAHSGFAERMAVKFLEEQKSSDHKATYIIAGFNALTRAENRVFELLSEIHDLHYFWDYDVYYTENKAQEAGHFARLNFKTLSGQTINGTGNHFREISKNVNVYRCNTSIEQAFVANHLVRELAEAGNSDQTALVLAEENLLLPVLQHLPDNVKEANVTMGYPLKLSPFHALFEAMIRLYFNRSVGPDQKNRGFYHKDVMRLLLDDSLERYSVGKEKELRANLANEIREQNMLHVPLFKMADALLPEGRNPHLAFNESADIPSVIRQIKAVIEELDHRLTENKSLSGKMAREFLLHHLEVVQETEKIQVQLKDALDMRSFYRIWRQNVNGAKVQFTGEPLMGLQIMGLLETRNLDFENVIVLSVNEGVLPSARSYGSLLPNDLKRAFGLMIHNEREAVIAFHFYRLLQRAKNVHLIYHTQSTDIGSAERSRFVNQLERELTAYAAEHTFRELPVTIPFEPGVLKTKEIDHGNIVEMYVTERWKSGLSPTAISTYLNCPLYFYYKYILNLREPDELIDQVEADVMGLALHECLETLYQPHIGKKLIQDDIKQMSENYKAVLTKAFEKHLHKTYLMEGKNLLTFHMASRFTEQFLKDEFQRVGKCSVVVQALEQKVERTLQLEIQDKQYEIKLKGIIDRVETVNGQWQIMDYKTGKVVSADLSLKSMEDVFEGKKNKALQLLLYNWMYAPQTTGPVRSYIYSLRSYSQALLPLRIDKDQDITSDQLSQLEVGLKELLVRMLTQRTFTHESKALYCKYC